MAKRYAVADKNGMIVNHILMDDPLPKGYWPGYGATLLPLETVSTSKGGAAIPVVVFDKWPIFPQIGDTVNLTTGQVTKFVPTIASDGGESAPLIKFAADIAPISAGTTITPKTNVS